MRKMFKGPYDKFAEDVLKEIELAIYEEIYEKLGIGFGQAFQLVTNKGVLVTQGNMIFDEGGNLNKDYKQYRDNIKEGIETFAQKDVNKVFGVFFQGQRNMYVNRAAENLVHEFLDREDFFLSDVFGDKSVFSAVRILLKSIVEGGKNTKEMVTRSMSEVFTKVTLSEQIKNYLNPFPNHGDIDVSSELKHLTRNTQKDVESKDYITFKEQQDEREVESDRSQEPAVLNNNEEVGAEKPVEPTSSVKLKLEVRKEEQDGKEVESDCSQEPAVRNNNEEVGVKSIASTSSEELEVEKEEQDEKEVESDRSQSNVGREEITNPFHEKERVSDSLELDSVNGRQL